MPDTLEPIDLERWTCPLPLLDHPRIVMGRGGGGKLSAELIENIFFAGVENQDLVELQLPVQAMMRTSSNIHVLRDPTRGGVASSLNEIAAASKVGIRIDETALPVKPQVAAACEILGLDPMYVANEGKLLAIVAPEDAAALLKCMQAHPLGHGVAIIGHGPEEHPGMLTARTSIGATRIIPMQIGEQLPCIC